MKKNIYVQVLDNSVFHIIDVEDSEVYGWDDEVGSPALIRHIGDSIARGKLFKVTGGGFAFSRWHGFNAEQVTGIGVYS